MISPIVLYKLHKNLCNIRLKAKLSKAKSWTYGIKKHRNPEVRMNCTATVAKAIGKWFLLVIFAHCTFYRHLRTVSGFPPSIEGTAIIRSVNRI